VLQQDSANDGLKARMKEISEEEMADAIKFAHEAY